MIDLDAHVRKMVIDGTTRPAIVAALEAQLAAAEARSKRGSSTKGEREAEQSQIEWIRRVLFFLNTRLVPSLTTDADMALFRILQDLR